MMYAATICACAAPASPEVLPTAPAFVGWSMPAARGSFALPPARLTHNNDVVSDLVTGLQWERKIVPKLSWQDGTKHCETLTTGGHLDWRVPNRLELVSILDPGRSPMFDEDVFVGMVPDYFWTASHVAGSSSVWTVYFGQGVTGGATREGLAYIKCVRVAESHPAQPFTLQSEEATDPNSGLIWQRQPFSVLLTWRLADEHCGAHGGPHRWRLPSIKELQTIVDERKVPPSFTGDLLGSTTVPLWAADAAGTSHFVMSADGTTHWQDAVSLAAAVCVR